MIESTKYYRQVAAQSDNWRDEFEIDVEHLDIQRHHVREMNVVLKKTQHRVVVRTILEAVLP